MTNQRDVLSRLGLAFLDLFRNGAIVIDGHSVAEDFDMQSPIHQNEIRAIVEADLREAVKIRDEIVTGFAANSDAVHIAVGMSILDSIAIGRRASIYFCHHGTVQHKVGWFTNKPGMVHCNRATIETNPGHWVAAQSEVAVIPEYLPAFHVDDAESNSASEFSHLFHHENYTMIDPHLVVSYFLAFASKQLGG